MADLPSAGRHRQVVELRGHIIDSLMLPRIMEELMGLGVEYEIQQLDVGHRQSDTSYARLELSSPSDVLLATALREIQAFGASPVDVVDATFAPAPADGVFPEHFFATTNLETEVHLGGVGWTRVRYPEMDCGIVVREGVPQCEPMSDVHCGEPVLLTGGGIRMSPVERPRGTTPMFGFMGSTISSEKPKGSVIRQAAEWMRIARREGKQILVVAGPAVVHTGSRESFVRLIETGYVDTVFAGNALAVHDIEIAFFGTSLGVPLDGGPSLDSGHEHHVRAINRIRAAGSIRAAVESGALTSGIMHACTVRGTDVVLCGSIRDDGPLPDVITDVIASQRAMRSRVREGVGIALMLSSMLHSIAVGNLLPASVPTVCVDINPSVHTKLADRGSFQTVGLVMDVGSFLSDLLAVLSEPA